MPDTTISTVTKMLESLPEFSQDCVVEHLRDEMKWDQSFKRTSSRLVEAAQQARKEIAAGNAQAMDFEKL